MEQIEHSESDQEIVRSMLHVAKKKLNLNVVVEGIESTQQEQFILEQGCDVGQGFYMANLCPVKCLPSSSKATLWRNRRYLLLCGCRA